MDEFFFSQVIDSRKTLCIGPITRKEAANLEPEGLGNGNGLYMYFADSEAKDEDITIIARLGSPESAAMFANMLRAGKIDLHSLD